MFHGIVLQHEQAFFKAWRRGVTITGTRWFGDGKTAPDAASSKWELPTGRQQTAEPLRALSNASSPRGNADGRSGPAPCRVSATS